MMPRHSILRRLILALALLIGLAAPAAAADPSPAFSKRAGELIGLLDRSTEPEKIFSPAFLAQVPAAQVKSIVAGLEASHGAVKKVNRIEASSATNGAVYVDYERAVLRFNMAVAASPPNLIEGLVLAGAEVRGDSVRTVFGELTALPGEVSLAAARLEDGGRVNVLTQKAEQPLAIGSSFKLFVLAELVRSVKAGERKYADVVALDRRSLPSGILQDWPKGAPITLHSLAALMISRSDNTATDTLLNALGRGKVEAIMATVGVQAPERNRPFLSTREVFALKMGDPAFLTAWNAADEAGRRAILAEPLMGVASVDPADLDPAKLSGQPMAIAEVEWFASPADLVRTLDWIRKSGDRTALDILAINPGLGRAAAEGFDYMGFKGGSEPGVLNASFLLRNKAGRWIAVSATWNDPAAPLDEAKFIGLMGRLVALMRE
ncbi:MAG TPA: serine hydrolase [Allosphingosinicella sp.]